MRNPGFERGEGGVDFVNGVCGGGESLKVMKVIFLFKLCFNLIVSEASEETFREELAFRALKMIGPGQQLDLI